MQFSVACIPAAATMHIAQTDQFRHFIHASHSILTLTINAWNQYNYSYPIGLFDVMFEFLTRTPCKTYPSNIRKTYHSKWEREERRRRRRRDMTVANLLGIPNGHFLQLETKFVPLFAKKGRSIFYPIELHSSHSGSVM